jgi:hypothetical protein
VKLDFLKLPSDERRLYIEQPSILRNVSPVVIEADKSGLTPYQVAVVGQCQLPNFRL